jgi:2-polyprenyl-6-methoxyphenol hydroxylase-like FAD-dependent oxidoreductase
MSSPSIAIVGGGLGGLVLARILQVHNIDSTVYELETGLDARAQGGLLDLHEESGQLALRKAGLHDEFRRLVQPQGEAMRVMDKAGTVFLDHPAEDGEYGRPEIARTALRRLLIDSLDPGRIVWGRKVTGIRLLDDGQHELTFADGGRTSAELVVGADGAWSKVRPLLSAAQPEYCGITYLDLHISAANEHHAAAAALVGTGMIFALSDNKAMLGHGGGEVHVGASLRVPLDWAQRQGLDLGGADPARAREVLLKEFADWSDELTDLIRHAEGEIVSRQIFALPTGHSWPRIPGLTLIGDAAHLMSPFAGEGANAAMLDGCELALALLEYGSNVEAALTDYEADMFPRAASAAAESAAGLELCFSPTAPREMVEVFSSMGPFSDAQ